MPFGNTHTNRDWREPNSLLGKLRGDSVKIVKIITRTV